MAVLSRERDEGDLRWCRVGASGHSSVGDVGILVETGHPAFKMLGERNQQLGWWFATAVRALQAYGQVAKGR